MDSTFFYTGSNHERHCNARCHASSFTYQGEASLLPSNEKKNHCKCFNILFEEFKLKIPDEVDQICSSVSNVSSAADE